MLTPATRPRSHPSDASSTGHEVIKVVLAMLHEHGMDVVFVGQIHEGTRRFRVVEALSHGPAAALATAGDGRSLLEAPVVLQDGRVHGKLCCVSTRADAASSERDLRWLRQGARLAARLLDHEQVLRELSAQSLSH
jgi:hypothetical protein